MTADPQAAPLTVAVSGHRDLPPEQIAAAGHEIDEFFAMLTSLVWATRRAPGEPAFAKSRNTMPIVAAAMLKNLKRRSVPATTVRLTSGMAEGADQLVAARAVRRSCSGSFATRPTTLHWPIENWMRPRARPDVSAFSWAWGAGL